MQVGSVFKYDKYLYDSGSTHHKLERSLTVQLSGAISISEKQPYQLKMSATAEGRKAFKQFSSELRNFFRIKEFVFSVSLLFLKRFL